MFSEGEEIVERDFRKALQWYKDFKGALWGLFGEVVSGWEGGWNKSDIYVWARENDRDSGEEFDEGVYIEWEIYDNMIWIRNIEIMS